MKSLIDQMIDIKINNFSKKNQLLCEICNYFKFTKKIHCDSLKQTFRRLKKIYTNVWNSFRIFNFEKNPFFLKSIVGLATVWLSPRIFRCI